MQGKNKKIKRGPGRPKSSPLTERELARNRKRRQRASQVQNSLSKVEVFLPNDLKKEIHTLAGEKPLSEVGIEAFRVWIQKERKT
jgi:hypothetical protein